MLLADDHVQVLESVAGFLAAHFDVVATAPDGRQAVDLALQYQPDVVVLDIAMPGFDGFQAARELRERGARAPVVFLTMHDGPEFLHAAIDAGAVGFVLKSRIHSDLISAIGHAVEGRIFVPSLAALSSVSANSWHAVQFHKDGAAFLDEIGELVDATMKVGNPAVVVADEATRMGVAQRLKRWGWDLTSLTRRGQYISQESTGGLSQMMRDGQPDRAILAEIIDNLERARAAFSEGAPRRLTVFGDIAAPLCRDGHVEAALEIERIWDDLTRTLPFFTVCSYPADCFAHAAWEGRLGSLCAVHGAVSHMPREA